MPLAYLFDENLRHRLASTLRRHDARGQLVIDFLQVGAPSAPPLGTLDPELIAWAAVEGRILVSHDRATLPPDLHAHLDRGGRSPGLFLVPPGKTLPEIVEFLALAAHASEPGEYDGRAVYIPVD